MKSLFTNIYSPFAKCIAFRVVIPTGEYLYYRKMLSLVRNSIHGSWGFTPICYENSLDVVYFCFEEEMDSLQFTLTCNMPVKVVKMWPKISFIVYRYSDESSDI